MSEYTVPSAPPDVSMGFSAAPPSYDEAIGLASGARGQNVSNPAQVGDVSQEENELKKKEQKKEAPPLASAPPPVVTAQPQPQSQSTYNFGQSDPQPINNDCCFCCWWLDGQDISDICYCIFCCSRHVTGHDAGCCDCGETCCSCPDGCCDCGDCDCDCGDCDCDCGDCDCSGCDCNCGDCTIL